MTTGRRQNKLVKVDKASDAKQQLSYSDLLHSFILDCKSKNLSPLTIRFYQDSAKQLEAAFRDQELVLDIYSVTSRDIKNHFIAYLFDQGKSDNTVNGRIKAIKQFLRYLFEEGWLLQNLSDEIHATKAEKLMIQTFTKEQVVALLEQPDRNTFSGFRDYTMMLVLLETGM
ncbi:site-specific integrase [Paenibacillus sp. N3.4]|uniref:tyrosine-type recombinase/integrase n=1 Tax=Paenibacillus sp. N3.4 TaxID=2603222 RepID=UPI0021C4C49A|nr:site-specific integrase [Paenibacillus sp. N3.4]